MIVLSNFKEQSLEALVPQFVMITSQIDTIMQSMVCYRVVLERLE